jgi:hypothetical protein
MIIKPKSYPRFFSPIFKFLLGPILVLRESSLKRIFFIINLYIYFLIFIKLLRKPQPQPNPMASQAQFH